MIPGPRTPGEIQAYITTLPASVLFASIWTEQPA